MAWGRPTRKKNDALKKFAAQGGKKKPMPRGIKSAHSRAAFKYGKTSLTKREIDSVRTRKPKRRLPQGRPMRPGYADSRAGFGYGKNKPGGGRF